MQLKPWIPMSVALLLVGCGEGLGPDEAAGEELGVDTSELVVTMDQAHGSHGNSAVARGRKLFTAEKFNGNGRTCETCHGLQTGTLSPKQAKARFSKNPNDPLFRRIDSNDGVGTNYSDLLNHATVFVTVPLPANVSIKNSTARSVSLRRGIPSVVDMAALDPFIMLDGRQPTLAAQALGAANDHAQVGRQPTTKELNDIVAFEQTLFSSNELRKYAKGTGPAPEMPAGCTASEKRGRDFFNGPTSLCGGCHSGPMLDGNTGAGVPAAGRFMSVGVSEFNHLNNPVVTYVVTKPDGSKVEIPSADPGALLHFGDVAFANAFKMTGLRNLKNTAPYFHDNSSKTLAELAQHYDDAVNALGIGDLTEQDKADLVAFMKLL